jgi:hypothetical protein
MLNHYPNSDTYSRIAESPLSPAGGGRIPKVSTSPKPRPERIKNIIWRNLCWIAFKSINLKILSHTAHYRTNQILNKNKKMNPKNQNNVRIISYMFPIIVLLVLSCNSSNQNKPADTPKDTTATATVPAPDPAAPFYGTWDREQNGNYQLETFSKATKTGEKYTGTITHSSNLVLANYTVDQNSIEIAYKTGSTYKFEFNVSNGGNTITLAATPPIVYTKGSNHTIIQDEALSFGNSIWTNQQNIDALGFGSIHKSDQGGWSGECGKLDTATRTMLQAVEFSITKAGSLTIKYIGKSPETYAYTFKNNKTQLELTRNNISEIYTRK